MKRLSNLMTRPPSNLKFKQESTLITVILFGHVLHSNQVQRPVAKYTPWNLENTIVQDRKKYKISPEIQNFYLTDVISDFCQSFTLFDDLQSF